MPMFDAPDGTRLHYADEGAGPPLLCLAGLTRNGSDFDYVAPFLPDRRLIRLDYRGRGGSAWADPATYTVPVEMGDAMALLDHLSLDAAPILGTSRGGIIAMMTAAKHRDRVTGICLNDIGPVIAEAGLADIRGYLGRNPPQRSYAEAAEARAELMPGFAGVPLARWEAEVRRHYVETGDGLAINYDPALARTLEPGDAPAADLWPLFDAMEGLPLALIRGAGSNLLSEATAAEMRRRRPDMTYAEVPRRGHVPFLDEAPALEAIRSWLTRL